MSWQPQGDQPPGWQPEGTGDGGTPGASGWQPGGWQPEGWQPESGSITPPAEIVLASVRAHRAGFFAGLSRPMGAVFQISDPLQFSPYWMAFVGAVSAHEAHDGEHRGDPAEHGRGRCHVDEDRR